MFGQKEKISPEEMAKRLKENKIEFVLAQYVDIYGSPKAKIVPISHFEDLASTGALFAGFAVSGLNVGPEWPDLAAIPDLSTLTILPWRKNVARFACNIYSGGKPSQFCARSILQRVVGEAKSKGFFPKFGIEPEFFLVRRTEQGIDVADTVDTLQKPCYDMKGLMRSFDFLEILMSNVRDLGWDCEAADHEDAISQYEVNFRYDDVVSMADKYVFFKYMASTLAEQRNLLASFMPKPFPNRTGNGAHIHMSLWDAKGEKNLLLDEKDENGMGLSLAAYNYIGGLLKHARAYIAFSAPSVNSYKRLIVGGSVSGATWAPVYVTYGGNNRTQMLRIPGPGRIEDRTVDSSCNPYLAAAAVIASGLDGIEKKIDPGPRNDNNMYVIGEEQLEQTGIKLLPSTMKEAIEELNNDDVIIQSLGRDFCNFYMKFKMLEWTEYHNTVSKWEVDKYLGLV
ncbi:MAG: type III glutamate--ammonia ligase [Candidatus Bathyarchaeia archaeon]